MAQFFMQTDNLNLTVLYTCCAPMCVILQDMLGSLQLRSEVLEIAITVHENLQIVWSHFNLQNKKKHSFSSGPFEHNDLFSDSYHWRVAGKQAIGSCLACDPGYYCLGEGLNATTAQCSAGYYCTSQASVPNPTGEQSSQCSTCST